MGVIPTPENTPLGISGADFARAVAAATFTDLIPVFVPLVANGDIQLVIDCPVPVTITETVSQSVSGTCTATVKINGVAIGGSANSVSSSEQAQAHSSGNVASPGDNVTLTIASNSSCVGMVFKVEYTRTLAGT